MNKEFINILKSNFNENLILELELVRFDSEEKKEVVPILYNYIIENITNSNKDVYTCSAIRKYVAIFNKEDIIDLVNLFYFNSSDWVDIELSKVCWYNIEYLKCKLLNGEIIKLFYKHITDDHDSRSCTVLWNTGCYLMTVFNELPAKVPDYVFEMIEDEIKRKL